jgi:hypothetical protein
MTDTTALTTSKATPDDRVNQVFGWILSGASEHEINQAIETNWPGAKAKPLIVAAMTRIARTGEADPETVRGWCLEASRIVYQKALEANDLATALRAVKQMAQLVGSNP